jgi:hypothetical protein
MEKAGYPQVPAGRGELVSTTKDDVLVATRTRSFGEVGS